MISSQIKEFSHTYLLLAGECNAQQQMPIQLLVSRIIEVASEHANSWGVGYAELVKNNEAWVLSRVTVEMTRYPRVNEEYTLTTWVEGYNRHFSERNFAVTDADGVEIGYVRSIWVAINSITRESADISKFSYITNNVSDKPCPIAKQSRLRAIESTRESKYIFNVSDIDFNRHVNSTKYIELLINQWTLDFFDTHKISRFEVSFIKECIYGMEVDVRINDASADAHAEIVHDGDCLCRARLVFTEENYKS